MPGELQTKRSRLRAVAPKGNPEDNDQSPIAETALESGIQVCDAKLNFMAGLPPQEVDPNELYKISNALSGLTRAIIETRRFELELQGSIRIAHELLTEMIREELKGRPELIEEILKVTSTAVLKLEKGA